MTPLLLKCCRKSCLIKTILKSFLKKHINSFNHHLLSFYYVQGVTIVENQWEKISRCGRQCTCHSFPEARLLQMKNPPAIWETQVQSLGQEDPLEKEMAIYSSTLAWKIPWTEKPSRPQSMGSQSRTRLSDFTFTFTFKRIAQHYFGKKHIAIKLPIKSIPGLVFHM